ncbi:MAG: copper chaperone PCu(A)C [Rhodobacteraceae bacterium]|nr:copper chaperone PCu(A)C [Paracoccaceae bacterium]
MFLTRILGAAAMLALAALPAGAHEFTAGGLTIGHPYAFETAPTAMAGGGFMTITNEGAEADRLLAVRADFPKVEIHETVEKDGVASMQPVEAIDIPAGATVELKPGGYHVMFVGLEGRPLVAGTMIPATLVFEKAGEVAIEFAVQKRGEGDMGHMMEGMSHDSGEASE